MALINCPECGNQVASTASSCPKCGAPISQVGAGTPLTTTQQTGKPLKAQIMLSVLVAVIGVLWQIGAEGNSVVASVLIFCGLLWLIVTKLRIWWHHK